MANANQCPGCNTVTAIGKADRNGVQTCRVCGGIFSTSPIYLGESYGYVLPRFSIRTDMDGAKYYDFTCVGSKGIERRHGWFDPNTKLILQVG